MFPGQLGRSLPQCTWMGSPMSKLGSEWTLSLTRPECRLFRRRGAGPRRKEPQGAWSGLDGCLHGSKCCPEVPFVPESVCVLACAPLASSSSSVAGHQRTEDPARLPTAVPLM